MPGETLVLVDIALRAGAGMLLVMLAALLARDHGHSWAARLGALFALGAAAFALVSAAPVEAARPAWRAPLLALSTGDNVVFWLFARALFDDDFRPRSWQALVWAAMVMAALACGLVLQPGDSPLAGPLDAALALAALGFAVLGAGQAIASWRADLIEPRRRLRVVVVGAAAGYIGLTALGELSGARRAAPEMFSLVGAAGLAAITAGVAWAFLGVAGGEALFPAPVRAVTPRPLDLSPADRTLLAAIERAMSVERLYRRDGLTIGALAAVHGAPEHRLRRLINRGLGHANFNRFLNAYRIADVRGALADPAQAEVPVLTLALDAGFSSLGPFNRAFKLETGLTPTAYRRAALAGAAETPPVPASASRFPKSARATG